MITQIAANERAVFALRNGRLWMWTLGSTTGWQEIPLPPETANALPGAVMLGVMSSGVRDPIPGDPDGRA